MLTIRHRPYNPAARKQNVTALESRDSQNRNNQVSNDCLAASCKVLHRHRGLEFDLVEQ